MLACKVTPFCDQFILESINLLSFVGRWEGRQLTFTAAPPPPPPPLLYSFLLLLSKNKINGGGVCVWGVEWVKWIREWDTSRDKPSLVRFD